MNGEPLRQLENRVAMLEEELKQIKAQLLERNRAGWESIVGKHEGDKAFEQIVREGRKIREADRRAARKEDDLATRKAKETKQARRKTRRVHEPGSQGTLFES